MVPRGHSVLFAGEKIEIFLVDLMALIDSHDISPEQISRRRRAQDQRPYLPHQQGAVHT
jgi:hypothetical protein